GGRAERIDDRGGIAGQFLDPVGLDRGGAAAFAVTALVGCGDAVAGRREGRELVAPRVREFREPVQQQDERPFAGFEHAKLDTVALDEPRVRPGDHPFSASGWKVSTMWPASRSRSISSSEMPRTSR